MVTLGKRPVDIPSAPAFLDEVKAEFAGDSLRYRKLLGCFHDWVSMDLSNIASTELRERIIEITGALMYKPKLVHGFNSLIQNGQSLVCCTSNTEEVQYTVLKTPEDAWILPTTDVHVPEPATITELRSILSVEYGDRELLELDANDQYLSCLAQLLQFELDDAESLSTRYKERITRCLYSLAKRCFLPPSLFLHNVALEDSEALFGGGFADIYRGRIDGVRLCVKALRMFQQDSDYKRKKLHSKFTREVLLWRQLNHPNVLPFFGASTNIVGRRFCLISPWMTNGNIMEYLERHPNHNRLQSVFEIIDGITYLHSLNPPVVHKDIKGANVLMTDTGACCIADFGLSSIVQTQCMNSSTTGIEGSIYWLAPEAMNFIPGSENPMESPKIDIFAFACTVYEIYTGKPPFSEHLIPFSVMFAVHRGERPAIPRDETGCQPGVDRIWQLVELCWKGDPEERPKAREVKQSIYEILQSLGLDSKTALILPTSSDFEEQSSDSQRKIQGLLESEIVVLDTGLYTPPSPTRVHADLDALEYQMDCSRSLLFLGEITPTLAAKQLPTPIDTPLGSQMNLTQTTPTLAARQLPTPRSTPIQGMTPSPLRSSTSMDSGIKTKVRRLNPYAPTFVSSPEIRTKILRSASTSAADSSAMVVDRKESSSVTWNPRQNSFMILDSNFSSLARNKDTRTESEDLMMYVDEPRQDVGHTAFQPTHASNVLQCFSPPATPPPSIMQKRRTPSQTSILRPDASTFVPTFLRTPYNR